VLRGVVRLERVVARAADTARERAAAAGWVPGVIEVIDKLSWA